MARDPVNGEHVPSRGLVYVAWGKAFVQEAAQSAKSAKAAGGYACAIVTDDTDGLDDVFDYKIKCDLRKDYSDKILMRYSPFDESIFLDTDTVVVFDLEPLFDLFRRFDVFFQAATGGVHYSIGDVPILSFPEISAGVIGFRKNSEVSRFFELWQKSYDQIQLENGSGAWDQRSLRYAAWASEVRLTFIQHEWQCYSFAANILLTNVKIFHGRGRSMDSMMSLANKHLDYRRVLADTGFLPLHLTTTRQYARFTLGLARMTIKRGIRKSLHYLGVWRLPSNAREM